MLLFKDKSGVAWWLALKAVGEWLTIASYTTLSFNGHFLGQPVPSFHLPFPPVLKENWGLADEFLQAGVWVGHQMSLLRVSASKPLNGEVLSIKKQVKSRYCRLGWCVFCCFEDYYWCQIVPTGCCVLLYSYCWLVFKTSTSMTGNVTQNIAASIIRTIRLLSTSGRYISTFNDSLYPRSKHQLCTCICFGFIYGNPFLVGSVYCCVCASVVWWDYFQFLLTVLFRH